MSMALETPAAAVVTSRGWLRNSSFDLNFILVASLLAIATGAAALVHPKLFQVLLILDLWLLGYHHVVSTFTRLAFDWNSLKQNRFLLVDLPLIIASATLAAVLLFGPWILATTYLYWQWFHYTRQSYGIERAYRRKADKHASINDYVTTRSLSLVPIFGIVYRTWQHQPKYIGMDIRYLPMAESVVWIVGALTVGAVGWWLVQCAIAASRGRLASAHFLYLVSHHIIFLTGYVLIDDITTGWLVLNVWHNVQYIMFVWWFNNNRFKDEVDPDAKFLSTLCKSENVRKYVLVCVGISTGVYLLVHHATTGYMSNQVIPAAVTAMMVINFHHYVVDGLIWKRRKPQPAAAA